MFVSGGTIVCKTQLYYKVCMETPCIEFYNDPDLKPGEVDNAERDYHDNARRDFEEYLSALTPELDEMILSIILESNDQYCIAQYSEHDESLSGWEHDPFIKEGFKQCHYNVISRIMGMSLEITFTSIPAEETLTKLEAKLVDFIKQFKEKRNKYRENNPWHEQ